MNSDIRYLFAVSPATANRILAELVKKEKLRKIQKSGHWAYELNPDFFERNNTRKLVSSRYYFWYYNWHYERKEQGI